MFIYKCTHSVKHTITCEHICIWTNTYTDHTVTYSRKCPATCRHILSLTHRYISAHTDTHTPVHTQQNCHQLPWGVWKSRQKSESKLLTQQPKPVDITMPSTVAVKHKKRGQDQPKAIDSNSKEHREMEQLMAGRASKGRQLSSCQHCMCRHSGTSELNSESQAPVTGPQAPVTPGGRPSWVLLSPPIMRLRVAYEKPAHCPLLLCCLSLKPQTLGQVGHIQMKQDQ